MVTFVDDGDRGQRERMSRSGGCFLLLSHQQLGEDEDGWQESCLRGNAVKRNIVSNQRQDKEVGKKLMCAADKWAVALEGLVLLIVVMVVAVVIVVAFLREDGACLCWLTDRI